MRYELLTYWGDRRETAEACAAHLARMLARLARVDPTFETWNHTGRTRAVRERPLCSMPPNLDDLTKLFEKGRQLLYGDDGKRNVPWPERGFTLGAWNGRKKQDFAYFLVNCGCFDPPPWQTFLNMLELHFEHKVDAGRVWRGRELEPVVMAAVQSWNVEYAVITTGKFHEFVPRSADGHGFRWPWAGWLTYLAPPDSLKITPPSNVIATRFPDGGLLTTLCDEPFDPDNPDHLALAADMQRALEPVLWA